MLLLLPWWLCRIFQTQPSFLSLENNYLIFWKTLRYLEVSHAASRDSELRQDCDMGVRAGAESNIDHSEV